MEQAAMRNSLRLLHRYASKFSCNCNPANPYAALSGRVYSGMRASARIAKAACVHYARSAVFWTVSGSGLNRFGRKWESIASFLRLHAHTDDGSFSPVDMQCRGIGSIGPDSVARAMNRVAWNCAQDGMQEDERKPAGNHGLLQNEPYH